uniref:CHCH domain-containing protein n=1 Tax=Eucampia antarctica TaxID=49252 RepID=A0A7S2WGM6_9STRA|mmetsp:Transcript_29987/g.28882  ORF Transcript_29987/g.28882 Transcript_29987/m.28882 type:complete len:115 (+) Transcript_29987:124-468(+)|eukprot:CAMPEP_0197837244 /NCGR_PEP_ID=MMETSP1437-20131217/31574_1 /TAXON_ID=49252 ORGANISM="Eucampia antarctica, Strain CCMP1452" /NCGR_SAMPLE_ID=MMETSP1437 /ASSEMBLY_ACC=CAM_ASM_001096 /LENGTH=114 /DNA_ID=CAMNT_0043444129 /DNA_START=104 /DNA_END=451 /DNA_ORIENTATION=+
MSSMNFSSAKQFVRPPQRGIFPLDHDAECKVFMNTYLSCLKEEKDQHNKCRELSKEYLQCRMDRQLMADEDLDELGYSKDAKVQNAEEYDKSKEKGGYVAGKHLNKPIKWWFQR